MKNILFVVGFLSFLSLNATADYKCGTTLTAVKGMAQMDCATDEGAYSFCPLLNKSFDYTDENCRVIAEAYVTLCESVGVSACDKTKSVFIDAYKVINGKEPGE